MWEDFKFFAVICLIVATAIAAIEGVFSTNSAVHIPAIRLLICVAIAGFAYLLAALADKLRIDVDHHFWLTFLVAPAIMVVFVVSILAALVFLMEVAVNA